MLIAYNKDNERVSINNALENEEYYCLECGERLIKKNKGFKRKHHFAHRSNSTCSEHRYDKMCKWHIGWQNRFPEDSIEVVKVDENGKRHIADVLINDTEIEFQHSFMPYDEFNDRNEFYNKFNYHVLWIFDGNDTFNNGYNGDGPFPFSKKFECFKSLKTIPTNVDIFIEGEIKPNLFTEHGLFLHHVNRIDENEGIMFDGKCTIEAFLDNVNNGKEFAFNQEEIQNIIFEMPPVMQTQGFKGSYLIDIINQYPCVKHLIVENIMTNYEVLLDSYNIDRIKHGKKAYGKIKNDYGHFKGENIEIYYTDYNVWKFKHYY